MPAFSLFSARRLQIAVLFALIVSLLLSWMLPFFKDCASVRSQVLRLHILAASDSAADQALKLAVRDRLLSMEQTLFADVSDLAGARRSAAASLSDIEEAARAVLREAGSDDAVHAELCRMFFPTKTYDTYTLPAGEYDALRVTIGEGKGHNWWCVLYPPLCLPVAEKYTDLSDVFTPSELKTLRGGTRYRYSFALLELWQKLRASLVDGRKKNE